MEPLEKKCANKLISERCRVNILPDCKECDGYKETCGEYHPAGKYLNIKELPTDYFARMGDL
jgi:hypothetical protein